MTTMDFMENVYEIAFGSDAFNKGYNKEEVIKRLKDFAETKDRCEECGTTEFLCGHNKRD